LDLEQGISIISTFVAPHLPQNTFLFLDQSMVVETKVGKGNIGKVDIIVSSIEAIDIKRLGAQAKVKDATKARYREIERISN
jgi:hypothetical protein